MTLRFVPFIFVFGFVAIGMTAANDNYSYYTTDAVLLDANSTSYVATSLSSNSNQTLSNGPSTATSTRVTEHVTEEFKSFTTTNPTEGSSSEPKNTEYTTSSQTKYSSAPATTTTVVVTEPETSHLPRNEIIDTTSDTHVTPTKGLTTSVNTTASINNDTSTGTTTTSTNTETSTGTMTTSTNTETSTGTMTTSTNTETSTGTMTTSTNTETSTGTMTTSTNTETSIGTTIRSMNTETSTGTMMLSTIAEISTGTTMPPTNTEITVGTIMTSTNTNISTGTITASTNAKTSTGTIMTSTNTETSTGNIMASTNTKISTGTMMASTNTEISRGTMMTSTNAEISTGTTMPLTNTDITVGTIMASTNTEISTGTTTTYPNTKTSTGRTMTSTNTETSTGATSGNMETSTQITYSNTITTTGKLLVSTSNEINTGTSASFTSSTSRPMTTSINLSGATSSQAINTASGQTAETTATNPATASSNTTLTSAATTSAIFTYSKDPAVTTSTVQPTESSFSTAHTPIVCPDLPCPFGSVCLNGTCQCLSGSYFSNGKCVPARVFPGNLRVTSLTFDVQMSNRSSSIFRETAATIIAALRDVLKTEPGYIRSDVIQLLSGSVIASVNNIFDNTAASEESIKQTIDDAISKSTGLLQNATFKSTSLCEQVPVPCDAASTVCTNTNGQATCSCNKGYISTVFSNSSCNACPSGQKAVGNKCELCSFGYAGFNCNDSSLLAVVIISCVLGGVLLILVLVLLLYCCRGRCSFKSPNLGSSPYNDDLNKSWPADITPIPRATLSWETPCSIELTEGGSTNTLVEKNHHGNGLTGSYDLNTEDMKTFKGKNTSRYSYLVQGHENPYFLPGDENRK